MYRHCPHCGKKYGKGGSTTEDYYKCNSCDFVFFNNPKPVAIGLILNKKKDSVLLTQRKIEPYKGYWSIPGGFLKYGECPEAALERELREELSVNVKVGKLIDIYNEQYCNKGVEDEKYSTLVLVFLIREIDHEKIKPADDATEAKFFKFNKLPDLAFEKTKHVFRKHFKDVGKFRERG